MFQGLSPGPGIGRNSAILPCRILLFAGKWDGVVAWSTGGTKSEKGQKNQKCRKKIIEYGVAEIF